MYTSFIKSLLFIALLSSCILSTVRGQQQSQTLDKYIELAFAQNAGIRQQQFDLEKAMFALKEAKSLFLPSMSVLGSYTKADGGRSIDVPVGDLVNPIYTALNELTASSNYPQISNQSFLLNPDNFYDLKMRTSLPLIDAEIRYNKLIKQQLISSKQASLNVYKRALVKDIKIAYYRYYQSQQAIEAYNSALELINENIRVNTSLLRNGVKNGTSLLRAQTEQQKVKSALSNAQRQSENALTYFNFLLNRSLTAPLQIAELPDVDVLLADTSSVFTSREELKQLRSLETINKLDYKLQRSAFIPKLNTFLDLGTQGTDFKVNDKSRYYLWGVNLQWDLFTGGKTKYRAAQARSELKVTSAKIDEAQQSILLQLSQAENNYKAASSLLSTAISGLSYAGKYYQDQMKAYKAGQLLYLELIDAQNELTNSKLKLAEARAELHIALAELERQQASYPLNN